MPLAGVAAALGAKLGLNVAIFGAVYLGLVNKKRDDVDEDGTILVKVEREVGGLLDKKFVRVAMSGL